VSGPELSVDKGVISEMVRLAAFEVPGVARVGRRGPTWRSLLAGPAITTQLSDGRVRIRVWLVARPGHALLPLTRHVRAAIAATIERMLGLRLESVTVTVDGVGG
jgi:uncharacterized alkaline shock family protein YloU